MLLVRFVVEETSSGKREEREIFVVPGSTVVALAKDKEMTELYYQATLECGMAPITA
jgi:hypothetical protein